MVLVLWVVPLPALTIGMEQVSREQAKRLHHLRKIDQRALRMAAQGTLQQAIQAIMAVRGCIRDPVLKLYFKGLEARPLSSPTHADWLIDVISLPPGGKRKERKTCEYERECECAHATINVCLALSLCRYRLTSWRTLYGTKLIWRAHDCFAL